LWLGCLGGIVIRMSILLKGLVIIAGDFGNGKTEVAINLAVHQKAAGRKVSVADLDLVNPYFRTREARRLLAALGIELVMPDPQYLQADLPIFNPRVTGLMRDPSRLTLLDAGGGDAGVTVLAALADALPHDSVRMLLVVNPLRPYSSTPEACLERCRKIEKAAKLAVTGIIGNANLLEDTVLEHVLAGHEFARSLSQRMGRPLEFITVPASLLEAARPHQFSCPVLPIYRQLVPPWRKPEPLTVPGGAA